MVDNVERYLSSCGFENPVLSERAAAGDFLSNIPDHDIDDDNIPGSTSDTGRGDPESFRSLCNFLFGFLQRSRSLEWIPERWVFINYAGSHWCKHADLAGPIFAFAEFPWILDGESMRFRAWYFLNTFDGGRTLNALSDTGALCLERLLQPHTKVQLSHVAAWGGLSDLCLRAIAQEPASKPGTLLVACYRGHLGLVQRLLDDPSITAGSAIFSAMMYASEGPRGEVQKALLAKIDTSTTHGQANMHDVVMTLMIGACINGNTPSIDIARATGENYDNFGRDLVTVVWELHRSLGGHLEDIDHLMLLFKLDFELDKGLSPFILTCLGGHYEAIRHTLNYRLVGSDISAEITIGLILAILRRSRDTIRFLLETPYKPSMGLVMTAAAVTQHEMLEMLLDPMENSWRLPQVFVWKKRARTITGIVAEVGSLETLKLLHHRGASVSRQDQDDRTALHWAVHFSKQDMVEWLLEVMPAKDMEIRCLSNETAYEMALRIGHQGVIGAFERWRKMRE